MLRVTRREILRCSLRCSMLAGADRVLGGVLIGVVSESCAHDRVEWRGVDAFNGREITLRAGPMPVGASFTGEYFSPHIGRLSLSQHGESLSGRYHAELDDDTFTGEINGRCSGNLAQFDWTELSHEDGKERVSKGKGYFLLDSLYEGQIQLFGARSYRSGHRGFAVTSDAEPWTAVRIAGL